MESNMNREQTSPVSNRPLQSDKTDQLIAALVEAQGELENAEKSKSNPAFKSRYADLPAVLEVVKPVFYKHGLGVNHRRQFDQEGREFLITTLFHKSGQWMSSYALLKPVKNDPQGVGSAITYNRRYDLSSIAGIGAEDDDGNAASGHGGKGFDALVDTEQAATIDTMLKTTNSDKAAFLKYFRVDDVRKLKASDYHSAIAMLNKKAEKSA